jgi:predicted nucleotidyltransferase
MIQYDAINIIAKAIIDDGLVEACYLKGSIARQEEDEYSDVDLYCLVSLENEATFLKKRIQYLETYKPILFFEEVNFVGPQLVCVFENGLHFDLYMQNKQNLSQKDQILVIYDPKQYLSTYQAESLSLTNKGLGTIINEFSFTLLEFYQSYQRKDYLFSFKLASILHSLYLQTVRSYVDPEHSLIPCKGLLPKLEGNYRKDVMEITKLLKYDTCLLAVKMMIVKMNELIGNLPISIAEIVNFDFFVFVKKQIYSINEE